MSTSSRRALTLYRSLLREAGKLRQYNTREYALRSVRTRFREARDERNPGACVCVYLCLC